MAGEISVYYYENYITRRFYLLLHCHMFSHLNGMSAVVTDNPHNTVSRTGMCSCNNLQLAETNLE